MTQELKVVSVKLPSSQLQRIPGNRSQFIRDAIEEKLDRTGSQAWKPKSATGRRLLKLRNQQLSEGGELLDPHGIREELKKRRGGLA